MIDTLRICQTPVMSPGTISKYNNTEEPNKKITESVMQE